MLVSITCTHSFRSVVFIPVRCCTLLLRAITAWARGRWLAETAHTETKTRAVQYSYKHLHYLARIENIQQLQTCFPSRIRRLPYALTMDSLINTRIKVESTTEQTVEEHDTFIHMARRAVFIDYIGGFFNTAVRDIKKESAIGLDAKVACGHQHEVTLLTISTKTHVYQFDILKLGMAAFDNGLREILESKIQKVIHNILLFSCLHHKYFVKLANVFDTQVGGLIIEKNLCGKFLQYVCSLTECMEVFLGLPLDRVQFNKDDTGMWIKRPLSQTLKISAAQNAVFLLPLQKCIKTKMLSSLTKQGINIFQKIVRDASNDEAVQHIERNYLVPQEFLQL